MLCARDGYAFCHKEYIYDDAATSTGARNSLSRFSLIRIHMRSRITHDNVAGSKAKDFEYPECDCEIGDDYVI